MYIYKATVESGPLLEVKYYKSIRQRGKKNVARSINHSLTPDKQEKANRVRSEQNVKRLLLCNFTEGDRWIRFSAPFMKFTELEFERIVKNFFKRVKYRTSKAGLNFKYIGFCESGKKGDNWHLHIVVEKSVAAIAERCWKWQQGIYNKPLYLDGAFEDLAKYITKDVAGHKRIKTSRNLNRPTVTVKEHVKHEYQKLERGGELPAPKGYYWLKNDSFSINDITGAVFSFSFLRLNAREWWSSTEADAVQIASAPSARARMR